MDVAVKYSQYMFFNFSFTKEVLAGGFLMATTKLLQTGEGIT